MVNMSKFLNTKSIAVMIIDEGAALVVIFNPSIYTVLDNLVNGNPTNSQFKYSNATLLPPFPSAKYNLAGGNQFADLRFAMNADYINDSYQYTNMRFIGTVSNMSALTNDTQVSKVFSFTFTTNVKSCLFGQSQNQIYNDQPTYTPSETSAVTSGDLNYNGQDEYVAVYSDQCKNNFDSKVTILEWNSSSMSFKTWADFHIGLYDPQVLALDLKGNGGSELIIAGFSSNTTSDLSLMFLDFSPNNQPVSNANSLTIVNKTLTNTSFIPNQQIVMDKGNIDPSLDQEFFVYGESTGRQYTCIVLKYNFQDESLTKLTSFTDADLGRPVFGSLLQNGMDQLIIPKREEIIPPNEQTSSPPIYPENTPTNESGFIYSINGTKVTKIAYFPYRGIVGVGNVEGTGTTDIIELDYCLASCTNNLHSYTLNSGYALQDSNGNYIPLPEKEHFSVSISFLFNPPNADVTGEPSFSTFRSDSKILTADLNFDAIPEMIYMGPNGAHFDLIRGGVLVHGSNFGNYIDPYTPTYKVGYLAYGNGNDTFQSFSNATTTGNFFNQSIQVVYKQQTYLSQGVPTIIAVIAAPPTKGNISQNYGNTLAEFGQSNSQSSSNEKSTGYNVGAKVTLGYEGDVDVFGIKAASFGASISASFEYATTQTSKVTRTIQYTNTWSTGNDHNGVVFSTTEYKNWNYTILDSSNPAFNGKTMTFSYPYYVGIFKYDADVFDQAHPGYNINAKTFNHTIGDPSTYPSEAQALSLTSNNPIDFKTSPLKPINQGTGSDTQSIEVSTELSTSSSVDYTVGASATVKAGIGGAYVEAEVSGGYSWGDTAEVSIGTGTSYSATIGQIQNYNEYNQWSYGWGMFVYLKYRPDLNISYQVIDFYTGNFGTGYTTAFAKINPVTLTAHEQMQALSTINILTFKSVKVNKF